MPKGVLGVEEAVFKHGILDVLERVLALKLHIAEVQIHPPHHKVLTLGGAVFHGHMAGVPAKFQGEDVTVFHHRIGALPQGLDAVELGVLDGDVIGVPQGRPALVRQLAVPDGEAMVVPKGVAQIEKGVFRLDI